MEPLERICLAFPMVKGDGLALVTLIFGKATFFKGDHWNAEMNERERERECKFERDPHRL